MWMGVLTFTHVCVDSCRTVLDHHTDPATCKHASHVHLAFHRNVQCTMMSTLILSLTPPPPTQYLSCTHPPSIPLQAATCSWMPLPTSSAPPTATPTVSALALSLSLLKPTPKQFKNRSLEFYWRGWQWTDPIPWRLPITFIELIKNPTYTFWKRMSLSTVLLRLKSEWRLCYHSPWCQIVCSDIMYSSNVFMMFMIQEHIYNVHSPSYV